MTTYDPIAGTHITVASRKMCQLAVIDCEGCKASFNGCLLEAKPNSTPEDIEQAYERFTKAQPKAPPAPLNMTTVASLRDSFAAHALMGLIAADPNSYAADYDVWAKRAFYFADAMLAARGGS